jgi:hypothetical protein
MDIGQFVQAYVRKPVSSGGAEHQFAAVAFDLGIPEATGTTIHRPPMQSAHFSSNIGVNSPSGPWCARTENWSPGVRVRESSKVHGNYVIDEYGTRETLHSEELLLRHSLGAYVDHYEGAYRQLPRSVSLYSYFTACASCMDLLKHLPAKYPGIATWHYVYRQLYVRPAATGAVPRFKKLTTEGYQSSAAATTALADLERCGWKTSQFV